MAVKGREHCDMGNAKVNAARHSHFPASLHYCQTGKIYKLVAHTDESNPLQNQALPWPNDGLAGQATVGKPAKSNWNDRRQDGTLASTW